MNPLPLAQSQFAMTTIYHFFFVPLTLGLSVLVAIMESLYVKTGKEFYKQMTKFWGKLFLINFAVGVVTGIVLEFQFGMNWSEYSRFVGNIFGAPLAIEALLAFFLESTFLGIWIFGWNKLSKKVHLATIWLVAIGSTLSALWILIANSFMHQPVGYAIENGQAVMTNFWALVFNPHVWLQFPHTVFSGFTTGAVFVMAVSAYHMFRNHQKEIFKTSFKIANIFGLASILMVVIVGHLQGQHIVRVQPMKMAAAEALWESENPASFSIITIGDEKKMEDIFSIRIPRLLSFMVFNRFDGEVKGIKNLQQEYEELYGPGKYSPPVFTIYWAFRTMVGSGFAMLGLMALTLFLTLRNKPIHSYKLFKFFPIIIIFPYAANTAGWIMTEIGRQPWVVFGVMKTADAVSPNVNFQSVLSTLIGFTILYGLLMLTNIYLISRHAKSGIEPDKAEAVSEDQGYWG